MGLVVYFSSQSGNTHRFVERLGVRAVRIPVSPAEGVPSIREPYILISPTYADGEGRGAVPKQVINFLNDAENRAFIRGVIGAGNMNFGQFYAHAGKVIAAKCQVPLLHRFELAGTDEDIDKVRKEIDRIEELWIC